MKQLQSFFFKKIRAILEDFQGLDDLRLLISEVNDKIQAQRLKILLTRCEVTDAETVIVQTLASDDVSKTQDSFAAVELEYFQTVLREIVTADERRFQAIACINLVNGLTATLSKNDAERLLEKWSQTGYVVSKRGYVHLGPRCIAEFAPYFRTHCQDYLNYCGLCSDVVFTVRALLEGKSI